MISPHSILRFGLALASLLLICSCTSTKPLHPASEQACTNPSDTQRLQWWREARFGMFIHWGPVSLKGTEIGWSRGAQMPAAEYDQLYKQFNPTNFNADVWVKLAKDAGMKYLVFTTKHHDGFCMWDTQQTDYNIMRTPFQRDVVKELAEACRRHDIRFCTYHSLCDWWHPDYPLGSPGGKSQKPNPNMDRYNDYLKRQLAELIGNYGPLGILWFDGEWESPWTLERAKDLDDYLRRLQPSLIINNRISKSRASMEGTSAAGQFAGDYDTPEQRIGKYQDDRPWETCMTICQQWAWKPNDNMKSLQQCLQTLVICAGGDGNLLFNVGPMPDGAIEQRQVERLQEMGAWLRQHGESIYATRGGPWKPTRSVASTRRDNFIYVHVFRSRDGRVDLPGLPRKVLAATLLNGVKVKFSQDQERLTLMLDAAQLDPVDTVIKLKLNGSAMDIPAMAQASALPVKAASSNVYRQQAANYGPQQAFDGDDQTRWATDSGLKQVWISADLGQAKTIARVRINEALQERIQKFEFQFRSGVAWQTIFTGNTIGPEFEKAFGAVTAQEFRLNILDATDGPTLNEIELLEK